MTDKESSAGDATTSKPVDHAPRAAGTPLGNEIDRLRAELAAANERAARLTTLLHENPDSTECMCHDGTCWACRRDELMEEFL